MCHHAQRVDAGVRPAGTVQTRRTAKEFRQRAFNEFLHARAGLLNLPAFVTLAVVGNGQFEFERVRFHGG